MELTEQERAWAIDIKRAAMADEDVNDALTTDFEYVQHAIVAKGKVDKALKRIKRMQSFKERYGIKLDGSVTEAKRDLQALDLQHPGLMMSLGTLPREQDGGKDDPSHVVCVDFTKFLAKRMKTEESHAIVMRFFYYVLQACAHNFAAIRAGIYWVSKSDGVGFRNFSRESENRRAELASHTYPLRFKLFVMLQAPLFARLLFQVIAVFMSSKMRSRFDLTGEGETYLKKTIGLPSGALPELYGGELAHDSMPTTVVAKLQERYKHMAAFRLQPDEDDSNTEASG